MVIDIIYRVVLIGAAVAVLYALLPDLFLHRIGLGSWKRQFTPGVALTFDDGPDPEVTPGVLDILYQHGVKATFFVVSSKAERYPDIIRRIVAEGHTLGIHSQRHHHAWLSFPWATWREWEKANQTLENIAGHPLEWVRPPWGTFNLVLWFWLKKENKRAVLWNAEGHDWQEKRTPESIVERILKKTREGTIIVLHDGGPLIGVRRNLLPVLHKLCHSIVEELKLPIIPLEFPEWPVRRRLTFVLWEKWEHLFAKLYQVKRIDAYNMLRLSKIRYKGPNLYLEDEKLLAVKGDIVGEIHLDSIRLQGKNQDIQKLAIKALRMAKESMPVLAGYIANSPEYREVKVFLGLTFINRGVKGLGFNVQEVPQTLGSRWVGFLQKIVLRVYHPAGKARRNERLGGSPKLVWIAKEKLLELWLDR